MLNPSEIAALRRRHAGKIAAIRVAGPNFVAPFFERERWVGDDAVECREVVAREECRTSQSIAAHNLEIRRSVEVEVHAGNGGCGQVFLLTVKLAPERADIASGLLNVMDGLQQHAARPAGRVVNGLALTRIKNIHHEPDDRSRGVKFAGLLVGGIGEFFDQIFIRLTQHIGLCGGIRERESGEVLDQIAQQGVRKPIFVRPLGVAENAVKRVRIRLLNATHGGLERLADICRHTSHSPPMAILRNLEPIVFWKQSRFFITLEFLQSRCAFLIMHIGDALKEKERKYIRLEIRCIHRPSQNVCRLPKMGLQGAQRQPSCFRDVISGCRLHLAHLCYTGHPRFSSRKPEQMGVEAYILELLDEAI